MIKNVKTKDQKQNRNQILILHQIKKSKTKYFSPTTKSDTISVTNDNYPSNQTFVYVLKVRQELRDEKPSF